MFTTRRQMNVNGIRINEEAVVSTLFNPQLTKYHNKITRDLNNSKTIRLILQLALIFSILLFGISRVSAQTNHYVRAGATGSADGSDWKNAYTSLPSTLIRGDIYYIADGMYGSYTFDDPVSGSTYIYIKKATVSEHGTDTGWYDSYGDGVAIFTGTTGSIFTITTDYIDIDGAVEYGFKIDIYYTTSVTVASSGIEWPDWVTGSHYNLKYIEIAGPAAGGDVYSYYWGKKGVIGINATTTSGSISDINIQHCEVHGTSVGIYFVSASNVLIEYCDLHTNYGGGEGALHDDIVYITGHSYNHIYRYNKIHDFGTEGIWVGGTSHYYPMTDFYIYGNAFWNDSGRSVLTGNAAIQVRLDDKYGETSWEGYIYNNTFANTWSAFRVTIECDDIMEGSKFKNNLRYNAGFISECPNMTFLSNSDESRDPFIDLSAGDLRLSGPTTPGTILSSPYDQDLLGNTRGADGIWDRGAYEYKSGVTAMELPGAPIRLTVY